MKEYSIGTKCVQAGYAAGNGEPRQIPIIQSTTFKYDTSEDMGKLFDLEAEGYFYSRLQNPTCDTVARKIAAMEGGTAAMLTSSGQAANFYAIFNICQAGDHFVCSSAIYGGTFNLFGVTLKKLGIDVTFISPDASEEEISAAFRPNTKALFGETISNPSLEVLDIEKFARIAHNHGVPLIVDNTFPTPINCRPFEWGADIVVHSTTKYMDGHATSVGGCIVDSGNFDWNAHADKFPGLCTPDESYHGLTYTKAFGKMAYITKATAQLMRDLGSIQSPQNAFLLNLGLETLHLRMPQHCRNAQKVAEYLSNDDRVAWVNYCGLPGNKYYELAQKYMPGGSCGVISFGLKGGREVSIKFMDSLKLAAIVTHVADARTCVLHPASHTHRQLSDEQLLEAGIRPDLIRFSVGIENADDIIADIRALVSMLPLNNEGDVYTDSCEDDLNRACNSMADMKADPRFLLSELSDDHVFFETKKDFAKNMVTGFVKLNGMTVGAVANCSTVYDAEGKKAEEFALSLTAKGCNKAAEFVSFCDAFSIPVLTLTNVNGFKNCMCSEKKLAKALARMTYAFSSATCPKVNLITGEAYGSAYVAMNSKSIGADMVYAYPDAKIGMMDSKIAAEIMYPGADAKEIDEKAADYEKLQSSVSSAAARGYVDLIIDPADTRKYLVGAFEMLYTKYVDAPEKKHGTK